MKTVKEQMLPSQQKNFKISDELTRLLQQKKELEKKYYSTSLSNWKDKPKIEKQIKDLDIKISSQINKDKLNPDILKPDADYINKVKTKARLSVLNDEMYSIKSKINNLESPYNKDFSTENDIKVEKLKKELQRKKAEFDKLNNYEYPVYDNSVSPIEIRLKDTKGVTHIITYYPKMGKYFDEKNREYIELVIDGKKYYKLKNSVKPSQPNNVKPDLIKSKQQTDIKKQSTVNNVNTVKNNSTTKTTPEKNKRHYVGCNNFPFKFGCKNESIKEIQKCLGLPEKLQTGNFGPYTYKSLVNKGYKLNNGITKDIYTTITTVCKQSGDYGVISNTNVDTYPHLPDLGAGLNERKK